VNDVPIRKSDSYLTLTASAKALFGFPNVCIALLRSSGVKAEKRALKTFNLGLACKQISIT